MIRTGTTFELKRQQQHSALSPLGIGREALLFSNLIKDKLHDVILPSDAGYISLVEEIMEMIANRLETDAKNLKFIIAWVMITKDPDCYDRVFSPEQSTREEFAKELVTLSKNWYVITLLTNKQARAVHVTVENKGSKYDRIYFTDK